MSRSGYADDLDQKDLAMWRGQVASTIRSKRGQAFLKELAAAMDAMPEKELIANELINEDGDCCTIGVVCKARSVDVSAVDHSDPDSVASAVGIARQMAAEIEWQNDENGNLTREASGRYREETPAERWTRMRKWVEKQIKREQIV